MAHKARTSTLQRMGWFPAGKEQCETVVRGYVDDIEKVGVIQGEKVGGIVPHAGWYYSGKIAAFTFVNLKDVQPDVVVLCGGHLNIGKPLITTADTWETPLGAIEIDNELVKSVMNAVPCEEDVSTDNTLEVNLPFVKYFFPRSKVIALRMPASKEAPRVARVIAEILQTHKRSFVTVGSSDLTHYGTHYGFTPHGMGEGALRWVKDVNDHGLIERALKLNEEEVLEHAQDNDSACSVGAITATIAASKACGAKEGKLVKYGTSCDISGDMDSFVGYASIVYLR